MSEQEKRIAFRALIAGSWHSEDYIGQDGVTCKYSFTIPPDISIGQDKIEINAIKTIDGAIQEQERINFLWIGENLFSISNNFYLLKVIREELTLSLVKISYNAASIDNLGDTIISFNKL